MLVLDYKHRPMADHLMKHPFFIEINYESKKYTEATGGAKDEL
jgi:hypothetical protein